MKGKCRVGDLLYDGHDDSFFRVTFVEGDMYQGSGWYSDLSWSLNTSKVSSTKWFLWELPKAYVIVPEEML